jgi:ornithine cyclodeaminase/alanine dehydrogenase-like protein (mu-crystallin family)
LGGATIATSQSVIDAESLADIGEEAFIVVIPGEIDYFNFQTSQTFNRDDVLSALETYKNLLEQEGQQYVTIIPPQAYTNENQNMARMILRSVEDGEPLITVMAVVMSDNYMALVSAASLEDTAEAMRPIFYDIIDSIEVRPPAA